MTKAQVQIPDRLYRRAKQIAAAREWSFAEAVRRGLEHMTASQPSDAGSGNWKLPPPRRCGAFLSEPGEWTQIAHEV